MDKMPTSYFLGSPGQGAFAKVLDYGGIITHLHVPDRHGRMDDVVLGFDDPRDYLGEHPYFGAIIGRVAGRITQGRFTLDGREYQLVCNEPPHHLHGGVRGFDKQFWEVERLDDRTLRLSRTSPDGEEGYPGTVKVQVTYSLSTEGELVIDTLAEALDRATPLALTHHSYFNLGGPSNLSVLDHELEIFSDSYVPTDQLLTVLHRREPVTPANDFRRPRRLSEAIPGLHLQHGDTYFVPRDPTDLQRVVPVARVVHPGSGRVLSVHTNEPCLQFYTGVGLDGTIKGKSGCAYGPHAGFCLECQGLPEGVNAPELCDIVLRPGQPMTRRTVYAFSAL